MNKEAINEMIEHQGVYEIKYKKDENVKIWHVSNIMISPDFGDSNILAYCHEACKELTFNITKILSIHQYWIGILSKDTTVPKDGMYLIAHDNSEYELLVSKEGDLFESREHSLDEPSAIAYHYIPSFGDPEGNWIKKEITMKKWENEIIPAPKQGVPIIAYEKPQGKHMSEDRIPIEYYCARYSVRKNDDISTWFKEWDSRGPFGWSERWDEYRILGYVIVNELDRFARFQHIWQRMKNKPDCRSF